MSLLDGMHHCPHPEEDQCLDEREGTLVCAACGLVLDETLLMDRDLQRLTYIDREIEEITRIAAKIKCMGIILDKEELKATVSHWAANGHFPENIVEKTWNWSLRILSDLKVENIPKRHRINFTLRDFAAMALFQTLVNEKIPRPMNNITHVSGVSSMRLWKLLKIFPRNFSLQSLAPSTWMPGLLRALPISYKESVHITRIADWLQHDFAQNPLTILTTVIYAYLLHRKAGYMLETGMHPDPRHYKMEALTKTQLSEITGVSISTLTNGFKSLLEDNTRFCMPILTLP